MEDNNSGKTIGLANSFVGKKAAYYNTYYAGPEKTATNQGKRHFLSQVLNLTPNDKTSFYLSHDYGYEKGLDGTKGIISAFAAAARFQANNNSNMRSYINARVSTSAIRTHSLTL